MRILVCGGAGYIGSHTCVTLAERGHHVVIADSGVNSSPRVLQRLQRLVGAPVSLHRVDIRDRRAMAALFATYRFDAVLHFAALKAVGESCRKPLDYFDNNIGGTIALLQAMQEAGRAPAGVQLLGHGLRRSRARCRCARMPACRRSIPTAAPSWSPNS